MAERGIDIAGRHHQAPAAFARIRFDRVITLCDKVREICPEFPGAPATAHWSIADPAAARRHRRRDATPRSEHVADEIEARVELLLADLALDPPKGPAMPDDATVNVRYLVDDVAACVDFYTRHFGFTVAQRVPGLRRRPARQPAAPAVGPAELGRPAMADGERPGPAGGTGSTSSSTTSTREIARLTAEGVTFRNEVVTGPGGAQVLAGDPSGNLVELFQPRRRTVTRRRRDVERRASAAERAGTPATSRAGSPVGSVSATPSSSGSVR